MTKSQIKSAAATLATILAIVEAKAQVLYAVLPPAVAKWIPVIVIIGGVLLAAFNQSLSPNHISVPVERAETLGLIQRQEASR